MKIGFLGLGKLGLPVALAVESKGHHVIGTDINETILSNIRSKTLAYREEGAEELLKQSKIELKSLDKIVEESDIIFVPFKPPMMINMKVLLEYPRNELTLIMNIWLME